MKKLMLLLGIGAIFVGCSSNERKLPELEEREHSDIERDYVVKDASSKTRPGWVEDAEVWAHAMNEDVKTYRFFSFETDPKVNRQMSCDLAKANARADIAGEIATFIDKSLAVSQEGNASIDENNPQLQPIREFVENTLAEKIQALIHGAAVIKTYWEKRAYQKDLGAKKDYNAYTCAALIRVEAKRLAAAVDEAANFVVEKADDPETKANVKKALSDASDNFLKAKRGEI
ncbi:MAG: hypothetical protein H6622_14680 [Halobacteriovoraceae bacterium]|nr:hypothetical protein [Halobacteriovoraceae bacterium]